MKIINKQYGYFMYFLIFKARAFLAGKSARVYGLSFERACIGATADLFNMKGRQQMMLPFLSTAQRQISNNNFKNKS